MDYSQFFHIETYSRKTSKNHKQTRAKTHLKAVLAEVSRTGYTHHIQEPKKPTVIYGDKPLDLYKYILDTVETEKDKLGRKIRDDTSLILGGIATYPIPIMHLKTKTDKTNCAKWLQLNIDFLKAKYGEKLKSIVLHYDETYPHIHFYVVNNKVSEARKLHDGYLAQDNLVDGKKYQKDKAYIDAMQKVQDEYFNAVGSKLGFLRVSKNPKVRYTRKDFLDLSKKSRINFNV